MKVEWLECLDDECHRLMNTSITIGGPGDRSVSYIPHKHISYRRVFCSSSFGNCVRASIENGLNYIGEKKTVVQFLKGSDYGVRSLRKSSRWPE